MALYDLHNHKLCTQNLDPHNNVVCPWNDTEILCDLLNDLLGFLTIIYISYILYNACVNYYHKDFWCPHNDFVPLKDYAF